MIVLIGLIGVEGYMTLEQLPRAPINMTVRFVFFFINALSKE